VEEDNTPKSWKVHANMKFQNLLLRASPRSSSICTAFNAGRLSFKYRLQLSLRFFIGGEKSALL